MRPPFRFGLTILTAFTALALTGSASANNVDPAQPLDSSASNAITRVEIDAAFNDANARIDERVNALLSISTTMYCASDHNSGFETCVVRTEALPSSVPASLAHN